ncbi:MAG: hypothetical protein MUQ26_06395, partial [Armatimonadetes bacterium]|nr:hypothetical protein [Armatimonadota bacterium]
VLRRWAEARMYRKTVQIAVAELRRASRASNVLEKLHSLDLAERKLKDALWLRPEATSDRFATGLQQIQQSRASTLAEQALPGVERLLEEAEKGGAESEQMLRAAGDILAFLDHYLEDDDRVDALSARLRGLGGERPPYQPVAPLSQIYRRPPAGAGCGALIGGLLVGLLVGLLIAVALIH